MKKITSDLLGYREVYKRYMTGDERDPVDNLRRAGAMDDFGREVRVVRNVDPIHITKRALDDGEEVRLQGYAAMFNSETTIGYWFKFREKIEEGAFTKAIQENDVRHLFNHDPNWVLGRNTSGTLILGEDSTGLSYDVDMNMADPQAVSVAQKVERGDVTQSSFAFIVIREMWEEPDDPDGGELPLRTILEAKLFDTSTVTYPAYEDTTALIASSAREAALRKLVGDDSVIDAIATEDFNPDLAPALRQVAQHAEQLAVRCEGETCPEAAEEAPMEETTRAAEEALEGEPTTSETVVDMATGELHTLTITIDSRNMSPTVVVTEDDVEEVDVETDDWSARKRELVAKYQDGQSRLQFSLL